jgi:hypothetical protein
MSLEWVRARAVQNEVRLRAFVKSGDRKGWVDFTVTAPVRVTIWVECASAEGLAPVKCRGATPAEDSQIKSHRERRISLLLLQNR